MSKDIKAAIANSQIAQDNIESELDHQFITVIDLMMPYKGKIVKITYGNKSVKGLIPLQDYVSRYHHVLRLNLREYRPGEKTPITKFERVIPFKDITDIEIIGGLTNQ